MSLRIFSSSNIYWAVAGLFFASTAIAAPETFANQETPEPDLDFVWSIDGGPYGSSRSLEPTLAIGSDKVLIDANVTKDGRRHEAIRTFDMKTGRPGALIEHPDGEPFEGLGDAIAINEKYFITALSGKAQFGRDGEILVYDTKTLKLLRRIKNPRDADSAFFGGTNVLLEGNRILAAAILSGENISTAWMFSAETGEVLLTINEPNVRQTSSGKPRRTVFGLAMAMNATHIAISANDRDGPAGLSARGIVYVFDARDGSLLYQLKTPGSDKASGFGNFLTMSNDRLYVTGLDESGALGWPTGMMHAYDLATGKIEFTIADPGVPKNTEDFSAGKKGWGFPTNITVDGPFLFSGLPDWSGSGKRRGGLIVFDARTGERLLTYGHEQGEDYSSFGKAMTADRGYLAVMQDMPGGGPGAARVMLFKVKMP